MMKSASVAVAAVLLLSGATTASAMGIMGHATGTSDTLSLSATQQKEVWKDLGRHATNQTPPFGFHATVGEAIPSAISTYALPRQAARDVPAVKPYRYAMTRDRLLLVNPHDKKIVDVVTKGS